MATETLPDRIPIFPLPNVVLFPHVFLPLHIFEPRYREMVGDVLAGDRILGMVLLRDGWDRHADPNPPIYPVGCAGRITHAESLPDGRYNIVLQGTERFRVVSEDRSRVYRIAQVDVMADDASSADRERLRAGRQRIEALLEQRFPRTGTESRIPRNMTDGELINVLAQYLAFEPVEKQALLESCGPCERCAALIDLLEMRLMAGGVHRPPNGVQ